MNFVILLNFNRIYFTFIVLYDIITKKFSEVGNLKQDSDASTTLAEDKILILYILKKVGKPLSHKELLELILTVADINYFYFQQFLSDLLEDNYIAKCAENTDLYELTEAGSKSLELTLDLIPGITKLKIDSQFKKSFDSIQDKFSISAEYMPISEKEFIVTCKIIENHTDIFKLETYVGSKTQAGNIVSHWNKRAVEIYPQILELLTM